MTVIAATLGWSGIASAESPKGSAAGSTGCVSTKAGDCIHSKSGAQLDVKSAGSAAPKAAPKANSDKATRATK